MIDVPAGHLFLGEETGGDHRRTGRPVLLEAADLTTHGVIVGMTGSGKTGLGVGLIEEALLQGIPTLVIDPKGDLGNLLLTFPDQSAESFAPWVDGADAAAVAATWKEGLAGWGIDGARLQALRDAADMTIYTPGSTSGVGLNVVGSLQRPADGADPEAVLDEVQGFVSGLLGLVGIDADPLASREHILLANLVQHAWSGGQDIDLPTLVAQVMTPPLRKLGVFELDDFFPPDDRTKLAMRLNGLLASPAFAAWGQGVPLDIERLLRPGGGTGCAIVTLAHLSDEERQLVVTLVLSKLVTWMRGQPGTDQLRVLVYFDEVMGYVPPTAAPPSKAPILTLLKQARAFGVGLVLATQNPVDVDYKALSNAGTWMIGRLQTEQDKARLLDGLAAAAGGVDTAAVGDTIAGLAKREFVLRQAGSDAPTTFTTRWAMSYLRGPLTREQIARLMADRRTPPGVGVDARSTAAPTAVAPAVDAPAADGTAAPAPPPPAGAPAVDDTTTPTPTVAAPEADGRAAPPPSAAAPAADARPTPAPTVDASAEIPPGGSPVPPVPPTEVGPDAPMPTSTPASTFPSPGTTDDTTPVMPAIAEATPVRWLDPAAPWAAQVGAVATGTIYAAGVVASVELLFDETRADLRHTERVECVLFPLGDPPDVASLVPVDHDPRDLRTEPPATAVYRLPDAPVKSATYFSSLRRELIAHLLASRTTSLLTNPELKLFSRPGETADAFVVRCEAAADEGADRQAATVARKYESRITRAHEAVAAAEDRVDQAEAAKSSRRNDELVSGAGDLLGSLFGSRRSAGGVARKVGSIARRRGRSNEATERVESAANRVGEKAQALADLEADLADELAAIADEWDARAAAVEPFEVPLEKSDIRVIDLALVWIPVV